MGNAELILIWLCINKLTSFDKIEFSLLSNLLKLAKKGKRQKLVDFAYDSGFHVHEIQYFLTLFMNCFYDFILRKNEPQHTEEH